MDVFDEKKDEVAKFRDFVTTAVAAFTELTLASEHSVSRVRAPFCLLT